MNSKCQFIFVDEEQVKRMVDTPNAFKSIENSYKLFSSGKTITPKTISMKINKGMFFAFPSFLNGHKYFISKLATFFPENRKKGLPSIQPNIFIYDSSNGSLVGIISARYFAGVRTALTSAVGVKYLATTKPKKLAIIGSGVQAGFHAVVLSELFSSIKEIFVFSPDKKHRDLFVNNIKKKIKDIKISSATSSDEAVVQADIIACVTDSARPVFRNDKVKQGACILAVGSMGKDMQEVPDETMENSLVVVDSMQQISEYGEIEGPKLRGKNIQLVGEIGNIILGKNKIIKGRTVVFKHHGLPVTDAALAESIFIKVIK